MDRIPEDVLLLIAERISDHKDVVRVAATGKQWHSLIMANAHSLPPQFPLCLCLPSQQPFPLLMQCRNGDEEGAIEYLSVFNNKSYGGSLMPEISRKWIAGSSSGWLVVVEMDGQMIQLLNPLTRAQIPLPSLSTFRRPTTHNIHASESYDFGFIDKMIISGDPKRSGDCIVMAIISSKEILSFCRPGDDKWTNIEGCPVWISDVIPYKGRFYAITMEGSVVTWDATQGGNVEVVVVGTGGQTKRYLVESTTGDLLQVERVSKNRPPATEYFFVDKLEAVDGAKKEATEMVMFERLYTSDDRLVTDEQVTEFQWVELESLGDQALFLGHNSSLALSADAVPGCKRNCIYFTDDNDDFHVSLARRNLGSDDVDSDWDELVLRYDMGIYDMEDGSVEPFGELNDRTFAVPPLWVLPNPW